jgi:hypothetical protein
MKRAHLLHETQTGPPCRVILIVGSTQAPLESKQQEIVLMLEGWRGVVRDQLARDISFLADVIIEEVLSHDLNMKEQEVRPNHINEFLKALYYRLPDDVDRRAIVFGIRDVLISEFKLAVRHNGKRHNGRKLA